MEQIFDVGGQTLIVPDQPVQTTANRVEGETRDLDVISPVSLKLGSEVSLFAPRAKRPITVEVTAARPDTDRQFAPGRAGRLESFARAAMVPFESRRRQSTIHV